MRLAGREGDHSAAWRSRFGAQAKTEGDEEEVALWDERTWQALEQKSRCYHALVFLITSSTMT